MCIVFPTEDPEQAWEARDTWLVLAPLANPPNRWFLTYINSFDPKSTTAKRGDGKSSGGGDSSGLMVFPVPNAKGRHGEMDFLLAKTSSYDCSHIARTAASAFSEYTDPPPPAPPPSPPDLSGLDFDDDDLMADLATCEAEPPPPPLEVQIVGEYDVSVAPTLDRLLQSVQWDVFKIAEAGRDAILDDMRTKFAEGFAFVIARKRPSTTGFRPPLGEVSYPPGSEEDELRRLEAEMGMMSPPSSPTPSEWERSMEYPSPPPSPPSDSGPSMPDSGFGIVFESETPFWPTVHEVRLGAPVKMDVTCVGINCIPDRDSCQRVVFGDRGEWLSVGAAAGTAQLEEAKWGADRWGAYQWGAHFDHERPKVVSLGLPIFSPITYRVDDAALLGGSVKDGKWSAVLTLAWTLPTTMENSPDAITYEAPRLACAWALGNAGGSIYTADGPSKDPCRYYTNTNVVGRRCTDVDVERLSAVLRRHLGPRDNLAQHLPHVKAEAESYVDMLAEVADFDLKAAAEEAAAEKAAAEKATAEKAAAEKAAAEKAAADRKAAAAGEKLCDAALEGDLDTAETLLNRGAPLDFHGGDYNRTPLIKAAMRGHVKMVQLLLDKGATWSLRDNSGRTALEWADKQGHAATVVALREAGAVVDRESAAALSKQQSQRTRQIALGRGDRTGHADAGRTDAGRTTLPFGFGSLFNLFGRRSRSERPAPPHLQPSEMFGGAGPYHAQQGISKAREQIEALNRRIAHITRKMDAELKDAQAAKDRGDKVTAMLCMKRRKKLQGQHNVAMEAITSLESQQEALEQMLIPDESVGATQVVGAAAIQSETASLSADRVDMLMDDMEEAMLMDELEEALADVREITEVARNMDNRPKKEAAAGPGSGGGSDNGVSDELSIQWRDLAQLEVRVAHLESAAPGVDEWMNKAQEKEKAVAEEAKAAKAARQSYHAMKCYQLAAIPRDQAFANARGFIDAWRHKLQAATETAQARDAARKEEKNGGPRDAARDSRTLTAKDLNARLAMVGADLEWVGGHGSVDIDRHTAGYPVQPAASLASRAARLLLPSTVTRLLTLRHEGEVTWTWTDVRTWV